MTRPGPGRYDPRILKHPEYHRSYHHYLTCGAPADEAARLAYAWTERRFPGLARQPQGRGEKVAAGIVVGLLAVLAISLAVSPPGAGEDTATPAPASEPATSAAASNPAPVPTTSPAPSDSPAAPPLPPSDRPLPTTPPRPPAPRPPAPKPAAAKPAAPKPAAPKPPVPKPKPACEPSYPDACLKSGVGDYDCESGSGNGPNYVAGPLRVRPPDPFRLDADGDGVGCENG